MCCKCHGNFRVRVIPATANKHEWSQPGKLCLALDATRPELIGVQMASAHALEESHEALLKGREKHSRTSPDDDFSSDDELELDELDDLDADKKPLHRRRMVRTNRRIESGARSEAYKADSYSASPQRSWLELIRRRLRPRMTCLLIAAILSGGLVLLLAGGSLWVYKSAPKDGVCRSSSNNFVLLTSLP